MPLELSFPTQPLFNFHFLLSAQGRAVVSRVLRFRINPINSEKHSPVTNITFSDLFKTHRIWGLSNAKIRQVLIFSMNLRVCRSFFVAFSHFFTSVTKDFVFPYTKNALDSMQVLSCRKTWRPSVSH